MKEIKYFEEIDSTNTYLRNLQSIDKILVIADYQTAGRGRFERKWISNKGENLTFSIGFENFPIILISKLNFLIPVVVSITIENLYYQQVEIKWPNDLLINGKKICGILIENSIVNMELAKVVIGIGINCNQSEFPEEIYSYASSLRLFLKKSIEREKLLAEVIDNLADNWENFINQPNKFYDLYKLRCLSIGKQISVLYNEKIYTGIFKDISEDGELILSMDSKIMCFNSGEITTIKE